MAQEKLSRDAWLAAGFRSLAKDGPKAVQINHLAKELGATKGSFYWHFKDIGDYKGAMLALWLTKVASEVVDDITAQSTPEAKLEALFSNATRPPPPDYGGRKIEPAMRAWALTDEDVAAALAELDALRLGFLKALFDDLGLEGKVLSELAYGAYIGLDDLQSKERIDSTNAFALLKSIVFAMSERK